MKEIIAIENYVCIMENNVRSILIHEEDSCFFVHGKNELNDTSYIQDICYAASKISSYKAKYSCLYIQNGKNFKLYVPFINKGKLKMVSTDKYLDKPITELTSFTKLQLKVFNSPADMYETLREINENKFNFLDFETVDLTNYFIHA